MPKFHFNKCFKEVFTSKANIIDITGGRGRGGSHFVTDLFLFKITQPYYFRGYFMRFIQGDIRGSLYQDFKDRVSDNETLREEDFDFNDSRMEIKFLPTGNTIKSKGFRKSQGSQTAKLKSLAGGTDIIIEECEEIHEDDFNKLADSLRTNKAPIRIYRVWNPPNKDHWLIKQYFDIHQHPEYESFYTFTPKGVAGHLAIITNYHNNEKNINEDAINRFEGYKISNLDHYCSDILGLVSSGIKGQVYKNWGEFDQLPDKPMFRCFGLDFGYVNDPTACTELLIDGDRKDVYIYERLYRTGMRATEIVQELKDLEPGEDEIICDNAEPSEIAEIQMAGMMAFKTKKGGKHNTKFKQINNVKGYKVFVHKDSKNLIFEKDNYKWAINPDTKEPMNKPVDKDDHLLDSILYALNYYHRNFGIVN